MCLSIYSNTIETPQPKIAKRNIICYKCLNFNDYERELSSTADIKFATPYESFPIQLGKRYSADFDIKKVLREEGDDIDGKFAFSVGEGMFHSHASVENAIDDCVSYGDGNCVFYAIIPKGALYYEGYFAREFGYASNELIITKNPAYVRDHLEYMDYFKNERHYDSGKMTQVEKNAWKHSQAFWREEIASREIIRELLNIPINDDGYFDIERMCRRPSHFKYDR